MEFIEKKISTSIGVIFIVAGENGLKFLGWEKPSFKTTTNLNKASTSSVKILNQTELQLSEYLSGKRKSFDLLLDPDGTDFQKKVWQQLCKIPFGATTSYKQVACKINNNKACRAVGSANGKNPICIVIPCHRVIAADGSIGGYSGGIQYKHKLLNLEKSVL